MDRSFLADPNVVKESRNFVCIRLATYEDEQEASFLRSVLGGRRLENTVFVFLSPDASQQLCRPHRGPAQLFGTPQQLVAAMRKMAHEYPASRSPGNLPQAKSIRLAVNLAACDGLPLVVGFAKDESAREQIRTQLVQLAYTPELRGRFHFFLTGNGADLKMIQVKPQPGIWLVAPGTFGDRGKSADRFAAGTSTEKIQSVLGGYAMMLDRIEKDHHSHVESGILSGVSWESEIKVTDPMSVRAREAADRRRRRLNSK